MKTNPESRPDNEQYPEQYPSALVAVRIVALLGLPVTIILSMLL